MQVTDAMVAAALCEWSKPNDKRKPNEIMHAALTAALAEMWRPIEDAPTNGRYIIAGRFYDSALQWVKHSRWMTCDEAAERYGGEPDDYYAGWTNGDDEDDYCSPTHFMPLPAPPPMGE